MVERSLSMREVMGSMPIFSTFCQILERLLFWHLFTVTLNVQPCSSCFRFFYDIRYRSPCDIYKCTSIVAAMKVLKTMANLIFEGLLLLCLSAETRVLIWTLARNKNCFRISLIFLKNRLICTAF